MIKEYQRDKFKAFKASISNSIQDSKSFDKARKDKKKKQQKYERDFTNLAIKVNVAEVDNRKKKKKDVSEIIYYNFNKKRH